MASLPPGSESKSAIGITLHAELRGDPPLVASDAGRAADLEHAIDFHHQLIAIDVFPNGNGRHARLAADLLAERLGRPVFTWGQTDLVHVGDARAVYVAALRAADAGDLAALLAFARS